MFERKKFKAAALQQLKGRWSVPILGQFLGGAIIVLIMVAFCFATLGTVLKDFPNIDPENINFHVANSISNIFDILTIAVTASFLLAHLCVLNTMYKEERKVYFSDFLKGLNQWWQAIRGYLWFMLFVFLWGLLFIIPAFVKMFEYLMMFPIMAEYPKISVRKAMRISKELTRGYKGDLFILTLSFLGWELLAMLPYLASFIFMFNSLSNDNEVIGFVCVLIGFVIALIALTFICTYYFMTGTNAYHYLKQTAIDSNRLSPEDFE